MLNVYFALESYATYICIIFSLVSQSPLQLNSKYFKTIVLVSEVYLQNIEAKIITLYLKTFYLSQHTLYWY